MTEEIRLRTDAVLWRSLDDELIVLDEEESKYLSVNRTGRALWEALRNGVTRRHLIELAMQRFAIDEVTASRDVDQFLGQLRWRHLLE